MHLEPTRRSVLLGGAIALGVAASARDQQGLGVPAPEVPGQDRDAVLRDLLRTNRGFRPDYRGGPSNHLSMSLCALHALGAGAERLDAFTREYVDRLEPFPASGAEIEFGRWKDALGSSDALYGLVHAFGDEIRRRGSEEVLREVLPALVPGVASAGFHGMIRTAYAVHFEDDEDLAHGLAYWATSFVQLGRLEGTGTENDPLALLERARLDPALSGERPPNGLIADELLWVAKKPGFAVAGRALTVEGDTLDRLARAALAMYRSTQDFTTLHAVTGTHALRVLMPFVGDREAALRVHWQALLAAYLSIGSPTLAAPPPADSSVWEPVVAAAVQSNDDHDSKLVFTCREEQAARGGADYLDAAARRVGLV